MKRTLRTLAVPVLAALMLAGCGSAEEAADPTQTQQSDARGTTQSDGGGASDDGGATEAAADENAIPSFPMDEIFATSESGSVYTLGAPEALASEDAQMLRDAGWEDGKVEATKVIPVEIDNSQSNASTSVDGLTTVSSDGNELEYQTLANFFPTVADDDRVIDRDSDLYYKMWDAHPWDDEKVAPTAKATAYIVVPHNWDVSGGFTYVGIHVDQFEELPMYPEGIGVEDPNGPSDED